MDTRDQHTLRMPTMDERLAARNKPGGSPVMHQSWDKLLFINWKVPVGQIRPLVPEPVVIDTYKGDAWVTITPLTIDGVRPSFLPALPYVSWLHELNLRTYVYFDGVPGVWFFSLDANNWPAVMGARLFFKLPYFSAQIDLQSDGKDVAFSSKRSGKNAEFKAKWTIGPSRPPADPNSLEFFLTERYSLYAADARNVYRCRIHHRPWQLYDSPDLRNFQSTVAAAAGLPESGANYVHFCGGQVDVEVWPLEQVAERL